MTLGFKQEVSEKKEKLAQREAFIATLLFGPSALAPPMVVKPSLPGVGWFTDQSGPAGVERSKIGKCQELAAILATQPSALCTGKPY